jgi:hypothetical protein
MKILIAIALLSISFSSQAEKVRRVDGISIIGNEELPKSLIIVPWKESSVNDDPNLPEKSLVDKRFEQVNRSQLLREIQFNKSIQK